MMDVTQQPNKALTEQCEAMKQIKCLQVYFPAVVK